MKVDDEMRRTGNKVRREGKGGSRKTSSYAGFQSLVVTDHVDDVNPSVSLRMTILLRIGLLSLFSISINLGKEATYIYIVSEAA